MSRDRRAVPYREGVEHGTNTGYSNGCRCERCAMAQRDYQRLRRAGIAQPTPPPVPLGPLLERLSSYTGASVEQLSVDDIAEACGVDQRTVQRWRARGMVAIREVDNIATRLGWHPAAIWGADWYCTTYDREAAA